ncbi:MAG: hypothetical protein C3F11_10305 [Methylocystaceae bacterium]|nr:MAG: hypothetical protein C3F11_10305 [Methylocystaceae bacterium]
MRVSDVAESNSSSNEGAPRDAAAAAARRKTSGHEDVRALLDELIAVFPACFKPHLTPGLPLLKVGVRDERPRDCSFGRFSFGSSPRVRGTPGPAIKDNIVQRCESAWNKGSDAILVQFVVSRLR